MRSVLVPSRVNDSDDLIMTESEVGKIALHIEKEMFQLFQVTDNRYKSKYRSIMFNLKDPKNQVCAGSPERGDRLLGSPSVHLDEASGGIWKLSSLQRKPEGYRPWAQGGGSHMPSQAWPGLAWSHQLLLF